MGVELVVKGDPKAAAEEVAGKPLLNLDTGLPVEHLKQPLKACLTGESELTELSLEATNRLFAILPHITWYSIAGPARLAGAGPGHGSRRVLRGDAQRLRAERVAGPAAGRNARFPRRR